MTNPTVHITPNQLKYLDDQGFPVGMIHSLQVQKECFPVRIWILDNSSLMKVQDAHILRGNCERVDHVTRWEELKDCVAYHADLAARFSMPSRYGLLNDPKVGPQYLSLMQGGNVQQEMQILMHVMAQTVPNGPTPLTTQLRIVRDFIVSISPQLMTRHQTIPIIIATQGLPTNEVGISSSQIQNDFVIMLRSFEAFPVCFVVRLCTDDEQAILFYNSLDAQLHLSFDVLDDFYGEALEVYLRNPWLNYSLVLHRYREMGFRVAVLDKLDERALTPYELRDLFHFLFDVPELADPVSDWCSFLKTIEFCMTQERLHWNPILKTPTPWVNLNQLNAIYGQRYSPLGPRVAVQGQPSSYSPAHQQQQQAVPHPFQATMHLPTPVTTPDQTRQTIALSAPQLSQAIETRWAKQPPTFHAIKPLPELLATIGTTFLLVKRHEHFEKKFHPFSREALVTGGHDVLKRAVRKMRFFLHPDRLPRDFSEKQTLLCQNLWNIISEAWDSYSASR